MYKFVFVLLLVTSAFGTLLAAAQGDGETTTVDEASFAQGETLFEANCAMCHQSSGEGNPPTFPALVGNEKLQDLSLIVTNIHEGRGAMPAFPQLKAEEVVALATYIRNAWGNQFGGVDPEEVGAQLDGDDDASLRSVWDGVYALEQAERGDLLYSSSCSHCHGFLWIGQHGPGVPRQPSFAVSPHLMMVSDPATGPRLAGEDFLRKWDGLPLAALYQYTRSSMPLDNPGALSDQEYVDIIAFILAVNEMPSGEEELAPNLQELNDIVIQAGPEE